MQQNLISGSISTADMDMAKQAIANLKTILGGILQNLEPMDRMGLAKMGDKTLAFVDKCLEYGGQNATLVPSFIDLNEAQKDYALASNLNELLKLLQPLAQSLDDTLMLAGSDCYMASLSIYSSVKLAAKNNVPGATSIAQDLVQRFPGRPRKAKA